MYNEKPSFGIKTDAQLQAEKEQPAKSERNADRLGAALLGAPVLAGGAYLTHQGLQKVKEAAQDASRITSHDVGYGITSNMRGLGNATSDTASSAGSHVRTGLEKIGQTGEYIKDSALDFKDGIVQGWTESSSIIAGSNNISFMVEGIEEAIDFNKIADKAKANAGLLVGGLGTGLAAGTLMYNNMEDDAAKAIEHQQMNHDVSPLAVAGLGATVIGGSGAGLGHVIHNQVKKNNNEQQEFQDYKKLNEMPPMPPISPMSPIPSGKDDFKY